MTDINQMKLPEGWTRVEHACGVPMYYQKHSNVITWMEPYQLDSYSELQTHRPPFSRILASRASSAAEKQAAEILQQTLASGEIGVPSSDSEEEDEDDDDKPISNVIVDGVTVTIPPEIDPLAFYMELMFKKYHDLPHYSIYGTSPSVECQIDFQDQPVARCSGADVEKAKIAATETALEFLHPGLWPALLKKYAKKNPASSMMEIDPTASASTCLEADLKTVKIDDPRVLEYCTRLNFKTPALILAEIRNATAQHEDLHIEYVTCPGGKTSHKDGYRANVSFQGLNVQASASKKRIAKQLACQKWLQLNFPHCSNYTDLLEMHEESIAFHRSLQTPSKLKWRSRPRSRKTQSV